MQRLVDELDDLDPLVVTLRRGDDRAPEDRRVIRVGTKSASGNRRAVARLNAAGLRHGLRRRPDVVISGHVVAAPAALGLRALAGSKVIQYVHGDEFRQRPGISRAAVRRVDGVIAVSEHARRLALEAGCDPSIVRLAHPGVDPPVETPSATARDRPTVVTVSRLAERYKGHDVMIEAIRLAIEVVPDLEWVVIGNGRLRMWLQERARERGIADHVRFLGEVPRDARDSWLDRADVFALPSRIPDEGTGGEGFGIVYLEAAAHRLPVVAANEGGAVDAVVDGETGLLVDPRDERALADALIALLRDRALATRLGDSGARRARTFTWQRHAEIVRGLAEELANR
jgi:phosphatidylinositol alpha-1,6-mannosyltransferase